MKLYLTGIRDGRYISSKRKLSQIRTLLGNQFSYNSCILDETATTNLERINVGYPRDGLSFT